MRKLNECIKDCDGRILKPDGWVHPDDEIKEEVRRQNQKRNN